MSKRRLRTSLVDYMIPVLLRNKVPYKLEINEGEEYSYIHSNLTSNAYHRLVERAMCEQESKELHNGRTVLSFYEYKNHLVLPKEGGCFHYLKKDKKLFYQDAGLSC